MALSPTAAYVDITGIHSPTYVDILNYLKAQFKTIYGSDIYLESDSQDGQIIGIYALGISDANAAFIQTYNNYSPQTSQGVGLSNAVQINGLQRLVPSNSSVDLVITGTPGKTITNGAVTDTLNQRWNLPLIVVIPVSTTITVTASAANPGAILAQAGTVTTIATPTLGWLSATNPLAAVPGLPVEMDSDLRIRQQASTMLPSKTVMDGITGALRSIVGVAEIIGYQNNTNATDANGVPAHNISYVINGGDANLIGAQLFLKKSPGTGTYGTTTVTYVDAFGVSNNVSFFRPTIVDIQVEVTVHAQLGYQNSSSVLIQQAVINYLNNVLSIGDDVYYTRLYAPATLPMPLETTYDITLIRIRRSGGTFAAANIVIAFNEHVESILADVTILVV